ncbi:MAG: CHRD domain-containing protein [Chitinophagaceae bacterium]|nr:CHRD domain-containing protein [Chitinophagaceae bacterium]
MRNTYLYLMLCSAVVLAFSCTKENRAVNEAEVIKEWSVGIKAKNMLPGIANRADTGTINFQLFSDNSIKYELTLKTLSNNDVLSGVQLKSGDPVTNGNVVLDLTPTSKFPGSNALGGFAYGVVTGVRQTLVDSLLNNTYMLYLELKSVQLPNGLARGQLNMRVQFTADITLTGAEEVPPSPSSAVGKTWLRITDDRKLFSRITITNNEPNDDFTMAHIHRAAIGVNGPVILGLAGSTADFGVSKKFDLDLATFNIIINDSRLYVNAHSQLFPAGKIRGQLRN